MNNHNEDVARLRTTHADVVALMLAAADDRQGMADTILALTVDEASELLLSAIEAGGTLVRLGDRNPDATPRELLAALLASCRSDDVE